MINFRYLQIIPFDLILKDKIIFVKNQFILRLQYEDFDGEDKAVRNVLVRQEWENLLQWQQLTMKEPEAIYLVQTSLREISRLKKNLDEQVHYKSLELFEYRSW